MFSHVAAGISVMDIAIAITPPRITTLTAAFQLLNASRVIADTERHANMALREMVVASPPKPIAIAAPTR